jgi:elongation factor P--beta-lysine ligase
MSLDGVRLRSKVIRAVRTHLNKQGFEEIEPQLFSSADTLEPTIYPFKVGDHYLPTSPESFLKQAMAAGIGDCFAVSHAFRNLEGQGRHHHPEFVMAEWYQHHVDYHQMIAFTQQLVGSILSLPRASWPILSWRHLWQQSFSHSLDELMNDQSMINFAKKLGYTTKNATWEQLFNQLADNQIVPGFSQEPFFLIDYPAKISPLAKPRQDLPEYAQRFELFINKLELANGNTESFDLAAIVPVMESEKQRRGGDLNHQFIDSLKQMCGQTWSGVGLGIDRLTMILGHYDHISLVQSVKR